MIVNRGYDEMQHISVDFSSVDEVAQYGKKQGLNPAGEREFLLGLGLGRNIHLLNLVQERVF